MPFYNGICRGEILYVYHITTKDNMPGICARGLVPMIGARSKIVNETAPAVFFTCDLRNIRYWTSLLYPNTSPSELLLLRFNLENRIWYSRPGPTCYGPPEFYIQSRVRTNQILEYTELGDVLTKEEMENGTLDPWSEINWFLQWHKISEWSSQMDEEEPSKTHIIKPLQ